MANKYYFINNYSSQPKLTDRQKELNFYREQKAYKSMVKDRFYSSTSSALGGLKLIILFPLLLSLISILQGTPRIPTFTSLLEGLSEFDVIPTLPFLNFTTYDLGSWTISIGSSEGLFGAQITLLSFNWLRDFVYYILQVFNVLVFIVNGLVNVVNFVIFFAKWIFLG